MRIPSVLFILAILALVSHAAHATVIDFEDLTPTDPNGLPTDSWGKISDGYHGFDWTRAAASGSPRWASLEGFMAMPGTDTAYAYGHGLAMLRHDRNFDVVGVDVGSYFHTGQEVTLAGWDNHVLKYQTVMNIVPTFHPVRYTLGYEGIDHFAVWAGDRGALSVPFTAPHMLCIDNITFEDAPPAPVPEPSTLLILGSGILAFNSIYRKLRPPRDPDNM